MGARAADTYRTNAVLTAPPEKLVVMLYDGALKYLDQGRKAMQDQDVSGTGLALSRAFAVVSELKTALDPRQGEVAQSLEKLYGFVQERIARANQQRIPGPIDEARGILVTLKEGWDGVCRAL